MQVILLERIEKLGQMGDIVQVKPGYARNYLVPKKKALRASKDNIAYFETQRKQLEGQNLKLRSEAEKLAKTMDNVVTSLIRQASDSGHLYGSVRPKDIAEAVTEAGYTIDRSQICLAEPIKELGLYIIPISLHSEVSVPVKINISQSKEEAQIQEKMIRAGKNPYEKKEDTKSSSDSDFSAEKSSSKKEKSAKETSESNASDTAETTAKED